MSNDELIDIYNESGNPIGNVRPRYEAHSKGLWHRSVHVWIFNLKNELLIQKRTHKAETSPGFWTVSASGHIKAGVSAVQTVIEEVEEEIGIKLESKEIKSVATHRKSKYYPDKNIIDNEFNPIFVVKKDVNVGQLKLEERTVQEVRFISLDELREKIYKKEIKFKPDRPEYHEMLFKYGS